MLNSYRHPDADRLAPNVAEIVDPLRPHNSGNYGDFVADRMRSPARH
jgi:hypothetical protein